MSAWVDRLVDESVELALKIAEHVLFMHSPAFDNLNKEEREQMKEHYVSLKDYQRVLRFRIDRAKELNQEKGNG